MLRWFRRTYPSYNLQPLLLKRYRELEEARAFNNWLGERRQAQEGQRHLDDVSRPQLRYARAERLGVERAASEVAQQEEGFLIFLSSLNVSRQLVKAGRRQAPA